MKSLYDYVYDTMDRTVDLNEGMQYSLNRLLNAWNAHNIGIIEFKEHFKFAQDEGLFDILPFLIDYVTNKEFTNYCLNAGFVEEEHIHLGHK